MQPTDTESETLLVGNPAEAAPRGNGAGDTQKGDRPSGDGDGDGPWRGSPRAVTLPPLPASQSMGERRQLIAARIRDIRRFPLIPLIGYYLLLIGVVGLLSALIPAIRRDLFRPFVVPVLGELPGRVEKGLVQSLERGVVTLLLTIGALSLVLPVAWVYTYTKRLRRDPSLVQSVIILPIVVTGILLVVKGSLSLAFALAGIVAAVRFRTALEDPKDAVYVFLAIGIGLAAGAQALDVALVMSLVFNVAVLVLWQRNVGSVYSTAGTGGWNPHIQGDRRSGVAAVGDPSLFRASDPKERRDLRRRAQEQAGEMKIDGLLLVHTPDPQTAQDAVEDALRETAREFKPLGMANGRGDNSTLQYLVRLKKNNDTSDLLGALDERWASQLAGAEYISFKSR